MYIIKQNNSGKWILIKKGAKKASKVFNTKAEAVAYAEAKHYKYDIAGTKVDNVARKIKNLDDCQNEQCRIYINAD